MRRYIFNLSTPMPSHTATIELKLDKSIWSCNKLLNQDQRAAAKWKLRNRSIKVSYAPPQMLQADTIMQSLICKLSSIGSLFCNNLYNKKDLEGNGRTPNFISPISMLCSRE